MDLATAFARSVSQRPGKIALFWGEREYSYRELWEQSLHVSAWLQHEFGIKPGARVGLWLKNCPEFLPSLFGILHARAVVVPINSFFKPDEVNYILADAGVEVLITDAELGAYHRALEKARPNLKLLRVERLAQLPTKGGEPTRLSEPTTPHTTDRLPSDTLAVLIYTSGTTGRPKGAMLSHGNLLHNVESSRLALKVVESDRFMVFLPLFHSYMLTLGLLSPLLTGGSIVLVKSMHPVRAVLQEMLERQVTVLPAIPPFYRSLINAPVPGRLPLRLAISGAAPLPVQVHREFEAKFHTSIIEGYGLSEASPEVTKNPLDGTHKPGSIGRPIPQVELSIQDDRGRQLGPNVNGELCVRGANVMLGYWNKPKETAQAIRDGWLLTGDVGYRDADGFYYITDRKKDMLLVNGINVYPREIEELLYQYAGIKEAAVVGKPDTRKGEQPVAFVVANEGVVLEEKAIQHFVRHKLADYKVPRKVIFLPALPRNAAGKILKTALRELPLPG